MATALPRIPVTFWDGRLTELHVPVVPRIGERVNGRVVHMVEYDLSVDPSEYRHIIVRLGAKS